MPGLSWQVRPVSYFLETLQIQLLPHALQMRLKACSLARYPPTPVTYSASSLLFLFLDLRCVLP